MGAQEIVDRAREREGGGEWGKERERERGRWRARESVCERKRIIECVREKAQKTRVVSESDSH